MIIHNLVSASASSATQYGVQFTSGTTVNELPDSFSETQLDTAINMVGYRVGTRHPTYPQYTCIDMSADSIGPNEVQIIYTWEYRFPEIRYEVGSTLVSEQTNLDKDGSIITATYTLPTDYKWNPELSGEEDTRSMLVDKFVVSPYVTIIRQEFIKGLDLTVKSANYSGKLNRGTWNLFPFASARSWMCNGIGGTSQDNGISYSVRYSFAHRTPILIDGSDRSGWDKQVVWIDPNTDAPPEDETPETYEIYDDIDFNQLGLE